MEIILKEAGLLLTKALYKLKEQKKMLFVAKERLKTAKIKIKSAKSALQSAISTYETI